MFSPAPSLASSALNLTVTSSGALVGSSSHVAGSSGFPTRMFTVLFAFGCLPSWVAHRREMNEDPATKIGRPQQLYVGSPAREYPIGNTAERIREAEYAPEYATSGP